MTLQDFGDDFAVNFRLLTLYRSLSVRLLAERSLSERLGLQAVALGNGRIDLLVTRDDPTSSRELLRIAGHGDVRVRSIGPIELLKGGGDRIDARSGNWGTLGCVVQDDLGQPYGLSCDHVVGHLAGQTVGDAVSCGSSKIGTFARGSSVTISPLASNTTDAALISPDPGVVLASTIAGRPAAPAGVNRAIALGNTVRKSGARTGVTDGLVVYIVTLLVPYAAGTARFVDQIGVDGGGIVFADKGDSGAVLLDDQDRVAGLVFAAAPQSCLGFANRIADIEAALGVTVS